MIDAATARTLTDAAAVEAENKKRAAFEERANAVSKEITKAANLGVNETAYWLNKEEQKMDGLLEYLVSELKNAGYTVRIDCANIIYINW